MTTELAIPGGLSNKEIIDLGFQSEGVSDVFFGRTAEEYAGGMTQLRAMCGEWPFDQLGFDDAVASIEEESGIERKWLTAVGYSLGKRLAGSMRRPFPPESEKTLARAYSSLCAAVGNQSTVPFAHGTPRGAGARWANRHSGPFFTESE